MDIINTLTGIGSAFGLSASAGLNAYIPMLVVALTARFTSLITLNEPYNILSSWPVIIILTILLLIEVFVDKIPAVDTANDLIQTAVRPAAGAIMFAASTNTLEISPIIAVIAGILLAGTIHATKSVARPAVTATTVGTGNWAVSIAEDIIALGASILAMIMPPLIGVFVFFVLIVIGMLWWRRHKRRQAISL